MKKQLIFALAVLLSVSGYAQTKGTSTLGLTLGSNTIKNDYTDPANADTKITGLDIGLGYGFFIKDNSKISLDLSYGRNKQKSAGTGGSDSKSDTYGASITYQKYFPLVGKFYAYAGGKADYFRSNQSQTVIYNVDPEVRNYKGDTYKLNAVGGLSWFFAKHWAIETQLLSAGALYANYKQKYASSTTQLAEQTGFSLNSGGFLKDTSFKIYFLF